jgi:hypothetical protein
VVSPPSPPSPPRLAPAPPPPSSFFVLPDRRVEQEPLPEPAPAEMNPSALIFELTSMRPATSMFDHDAMARGSAPTTRSVALGATSNPSMEITVTVGPPPWPTRNPSRFTEVPSGPLKTASPVRSSHCPGVSSETPG